ncbi:hypothetical protein RDI58_024490 [Solanum bulbocastanum]|uniref:Uncharacterized protein n=1 Tax=Solanum bulbocastanum TaxID=147425 RepID=A0AAN8T1Z2_SOLBU
MQILHTHEAQNHEVRTFYKELLGQAAQNLPSVSPTIMKNGDTLHRREQIQLAIIVTWEDVVTALQDINDMKILENNGFNAIFLKRVWSIVGEDIVNVASPLKGFLTYSRALLDGCHHREPEGGPQGSEASGLRSARKSLSSFPQSCLLLECMRPLVMIGPGP